MATIKEIAALAGVSRGTVDRVLNHRGSVNPETEQKVKEIAESLNYKPNRAGLVLAAQKKKLKLGVILFSLDNPFFIDVLKGVTDKAEELSGYNCTVIVKHVSTGSDVTEVDSTEIEKQLQAIDELVKEEINGLAIAPYNDERIREKINQLFEKNIPVVTLNTDIENSKRLAYVGSHYIKSGNTAAGLMRLITSSPNQEVVKIGIITGSSNILCHTERISGFMSSLEGYAEPMEIVEIIENHDDDDESYEKTTALLKRHPEINALFFAAGGVLGGCRSVIDLKLEKHLRIIAFDKVPTTIELIENQVIAATICQQPKLQGSKPLDLLFSYLTTGEMPEREHYYVAIDIRIQENI